VRIVRKNLSGNRCLRRQRPKSGKALGRLFEESISVALLPVVIISLCTRCDYSRDERFTGIPSPPRSRFSTPMRRPLKGRETHWRRPMLADRKAEAKSSRDRVRNHAWYFTVNQVIVSCVVLRKLIFGASSFISWDEAFSLHHWSASSRLYQQNAQPDMTRLTGELVWGTSSGAVPADRSAGIDHVCGVQCQDGVKASSHAKLVPG
jgi:hypothetical protein